MSILIHNCTAVLMDEAHTVLPDAYVGQDYAVSFTVDSVFGIKEISAKYGDNADQRQRPLLLPHSRLRHGRR